MTLQKVWHYSLITRLVVSIGPLIAILKIDSLNSNLENFNKSYSIIVLLLLICAYYLSLSLSLSLSVCVSPANIIPLLQTSVGYGVFTKKNNDIGKMRRYTQNIRQWNKNKTKRNDPMETTRLNQQWLRPRSVLRSTMTEKNGGRLLHVHDQDEYR